MASNNSTNSSCQEVYVPTQCAPFFYASFFLVNVILGLLGTVGNTLTVATLFRDSMRNVTSLLLVVLAVGDTTQIWYIILDKSMVSGCWGKDPTACSLWAYVRRYGLPFYIFGILLSNWITVLVTVHRGIAILRPHKAKTFGTISKVRLQCLVTAIFATILAALISLESEVTYDPGCKYPRIIETSLAGNEIFQIVMRHIFLNGLGKIVPVAILIIFTSILVVEIRKTSQRRAVLGRSSSDTKRQDRQLTILLILVAVVFLVCQIPHVITLYDFNKACPYPGFYYVHISDNLAMLNVSVNFVLYCLVGNRFRRMLGELCAPSRGPRRSIMDVAPTNVTMLPQNHDDDEELTGQQN